MVPEQACRSHQPALGTRRLWPRRRGVAGRPRPRPRRPVAVGVARSAILGRVRPPPTYLVGLILVFSVVSGWAGRSAHTTVFPGVRLESSELRSLYGGDVVAKTPLSARWCHGRG
jgi:hypothetical protein